ncbi:MAG: IPT/TIG domain-containing protein, partial [Actinobacteria bacterium]|nr:IPT/TIG domain-containing protein [Actinomycetota bacterium]MCL6104989.1 IPT/TIG domain-containing protein [Actinomycetota bacterium]
MIKKVVSMALGLLALLTGLLATTSLHAYPQGGSITAPTLTSVSPNYGSLAGGTTVTLAGTNFSTSTGGTTASFGATAATSVSCSTTTSCTVTTPPGPTGGGNVPVTLTTAAGTSSQTVYFDYTVSSAPPPTITSISPTAGPESGETTVTLTGTGFSTTQSPQVLGTVVYFGSAGPAMSVSCSSTTSCTATSPFYSGNYTGNNITVSLTVATAGGVSNGVNFTYILPPSVNSISPAFGPQTGGQSVTLTGANFNTTGGTTVDFGPNNPATSVSCPSTTSCTVTSPPGPTGGGNVLLTATTTVGGTSSQTVYFDYTVSSAPPPTITSISPTFGPIYGGTTVTLTGTGFSTTQSPQVLGTVVYFGSGSPAPSVSCSSTTSCTAVTPFFYSGAITGNNVTVSLTAVTAGGTSNGVNFIYIPPPTITSISPTSGPQIGGTTVTLTGTGFSTTGGGTTVDFGPNNPATSVSCPSTTSCTVTSPPGPTGGGNVLLTATTTGGGSSVGTVYFDYTVSSAPPPTITSISPTFGPTFAATTVTLTGTGFSTTKSSGVLGTAVYFGSTPAPSVSCSSTTSCTAITPFFYGGNYTSNITVSLTAVTAGGTSNGVNFTYIPPPTITSISSISGPQAGGTTLTLTGTGFSTASGATTVDFGSTPATSVSCTSTTSCTVTSPSGPTGGGNVLLTVTTAGGTSLETVYFDYTVLSAPPPTIASISPNSSPIDGSITVTLSGTGFSTASSSQVLGTVVYFGSTAATSVSCLSTTSCTAVAPGYNGVIYNGKSITASVTIATAGGVSNGVNFTYILPPSVNSISPAFGPQTGGTTVTLTGTGFSTATGATTVSFGSTPATGVSCSSTTSCTATSPTGPNGGGNVPLTVTTTSGGTSFVTVYFDYTVSSAPPPTITSISPNSGASGITIMLNGTGFSTTSSSQVLGTVVYFGSAGPAVLSSCSTTSSCTAIAPFYGGSNTTVSVTVTTAGGTSNSVSFTYIAP